MVLGDSFTWGAGLKESERYSDRLESMLNEYFHTNKIEVINCAYSGCPTVTERDILRKFKDLIQPDLIVLGFCSNDPQQRSEDYSIEKENFNNKWGNIISKMQNVFSFLKLNYLGEKAVSFIYLTQEKLGNIPSLSVSLGRAYNKESKEWKDFDKAIHEIKRMSDSLNCPAPIAGIFTQYGAFDVGERFKENELTKNLKNFINQANKKYVDAGFVTVNFIPVFEKLVRQHQIRIDELKVHPLDAHPSAKMNKFFADELFKKIAPVVSVKASFMKR